MHLTAEHVGKIMAWDLHGGAAVVRVTSVNRMGYSPSISYESGDGRSGILIEDMFLTLDQLTERWRPATGAEADDFLARYTPPPVNWH